MAKVMNVAFGIGIAVILFIVVLLGTQVFYPQSSYDEFNCSGYYEKPYSYRDVYSCNQTMSIAECQEWIKQGEGITEQEEKEMQECYDRMNLAQKDYGKNIFIINSIVGIIFVLASLYLISLTNIAAGTAFAGIALIIYGFMRGWQGTGDVLKFVVGLVVATLFVLSALKLNSDNSKNK
jgi:hypothetical protein